MSSSQSSETVTVTGWWYDPKESNHDLEHPKFLEAEDDEVLVGIKQREAPINLSTLCGVYRWVYEFPDPGTTDPAEIVYANNKTQAQSPGSLTISCPSGRKATLKNIYGKVVHFGKEGTFNGIRRARTRDGSALANNHWEFVAFHWKKHSGNSQDEGNSLFALAVDDDSGEPLVMFRYASPGTSGGDMYLDIAAKKERRKGSGGLTAGERERLGMGLSYPEVRTAALAAVAADGEGDSSEESGPETSSSEDESEGRKRRNARTDERGARKKRRSA